MDFYVFSLNLSQNTISFRTTCDVFLFFPWLRFIYFGGYGCKTIGQVQNTTSASFVVDEMSWVNDNNHAAYCMITLAYCLFGTHHIPNLYFSGNHWRRFIQVLGLEQWSQCLWTTYGHVEYARDSGECNMISCKPVVNREGCSIYLCVFICLSISFLCPGSCPCAQRLPCKCPYRKQRLHLWWRGEFALPTCIHCS